MEAVLLGFDLVPGYLMCTCVIFHIFHGIYLFFLTKGGENFLAWQHG